MIGGFSDNLDEVRGGEGGRFNCSRARASWCGSALVLKLEIRPGSGGGVGLLARSGVANPTESVDSSDSTDLVVDLAT